MVDIVRQGKALYIGISRWPLEALHVAHDYLKAHDVPMLIYQGRINLLDREPINEGILDYCQRQGIGFISFSPLAQGLLTDRYLHGVPDDSRMARNHFLKKERLTPELLNYLQRLNATATERGESLAEMALSWVLHQQGITSVLVGASNPEQLQKNLRSVHAQPFDENIEAIV